MWFGGLLLVRSFVPALVCELMNPEHPAKESRLACCLVTGMVGGVVLVAVLLTGAAIVGFLHFRSVGQRQLAEQQAVIAEQLQARMATDAENEVVVPDAATGEVIDSSRLSDAIRLVPPASIPRSLLELSIDREGRVRSDGQTLNADALQRILLTEATAQGVPPQVLIRAEEQCLFGHIAAVLATCREAGVRDIQLKTTAEP